MTPERLEEIRAEFERSVPLKNNSRITQIGELLAEVDRLTRENRELRERIEFLEEQGDIMLD